MRYFETFSSNTIAGSGNHYHFCQEEVGVGRIFYKVTVGGEYNYSFLFSNIIDGTYSNGAFSHSNLICSSWKLHGLRVGVFESDFFGEVPETMTDAQMDCAMQEVTIGGSPAKTVMPGEFFCTDPLRIAAKKGDYLCIEMTFSGSMIPSHFESVLPTYRKEGEQWVLSKDMPFPGMIGCDRAVKARVGFLGDSITQGCGMPINAYKHWNAQLIEKFGEEYAFWNLGIGYGRGADAASDGAWLYKAKHNDFVVVCYGVNDINQGYGAQEIKQSLLKIVDRLHEAGAKVLLQTVPPFDYDREHKEIWIEVNRYILEELSKKAEAVFDVVPLLGKEEPYSEVSLYGGHPNEKGCTVWADALYPVFKQFLDSAQ